jgi:hypothetical protein
MTASGLDSALRLSWLNFRFTPENGRVADIPDRQVRAKNRLMPCSKQAYSITWSARSNMEVGIVRMSTARLQGHHKM